MMKSSMLRLPAVKACTGLSRSTIYLRISKGAFPAPVALGGRAVAWIEQEIDDWVARQIEISRQSTDAQADPHIAKGPKGDDR